MRTHHAFLAGFAGGLLLSTETLVVALVFFGLGAAVVLFFSAIRELFGWARGLLERRAFSGDGPALEEPPSPSPPEDWWT